jgi:hypothetical protein
MLFDMENLNSALVLSAAADRYEAVGRRYAPLGSDYGLLIVAMAAGSQGTPRQVRR